MRCLKLIALASAAVLLFLAAGCGNTVSPTASPSPTPTPQLASQLPSGTFANESTGDGPEQLILYDESHFTLTVPYAGRTIEGAFSQARDQATFTETKGGVCIRTPGSYTWAFDGKTLTFILVQDTCDPRSHDFPSGPWIKQP